MSLPESLERAASRLPSLADRIRPANGDPHRLLDLLAPAEAAQVLGLVLADAQAAGEELLLDWARSEKGAAILAGVDEGPLPKASRKLLRRELHRLRAQGVAVEGQVQPPAAPGGRRLAVIEDRWQAAHLSAPDFRGTRMAYLVDNHPAGGARLFEIRFDPARGILDFKIYNAGRSKVRGFLKSLVEGAGQRLFEADHTAVCALVRRASLAQPAERALPTFFVEWRSRLFSDALEQAATPGELVRRALGPATDPIKSVEQVAEAIRAGRVGPWPPSSTWVGERMERLQQAIAECAGEERSRRIAAWQTEISEELAASAGSQALPEQLGEWAWIEWQRGEDERARAWLAAAAVLADGADASPRLAIARARVDALFGPFLAALNLENDEK